MTSPSHSVAAPGWPGIAPTWTSSAKDMVTTALGPSRIWATVGHGIVNEVYWPSAGRPQIRDLGFIIAGHSGWREVKRVARYQLSLPKLYVPLPRIIHEGDDYRLELQLSPDPVRDVLLIAFRLTGNGELYALLAPHLGGSGLNNNARAAEGLLGWKDANAIYLAGDCGFSCASAGYVGYSDGWHDLSRHGRMRWTHREAREGNVALMGELSAPQDTMALGFADSPEGARTLARSSLGEGFESIRSACAADWKAWAAGLV